MAGRSKRSAARSATRLEDVVFVIDECLGGNLVRDALRNEGANVRLVKEEFGEGAQDVEWLPEVGRRRWIVLTKDHRIRRRPVEKAAFLDARVRGFFLSAKGLKGAEVAQLFVAHLPLMQRIISRYPPPFIAIVRREGVVLHEEGSPRRPRRSPGAG